MDLLQRRMSMKTELHYYDIFPKVVRAGIPTEITIRPLGLQSAFPQRGRMRIQPLHERTHALDKVRRGGETMEYTVGKDGCLRFTHAFCGEQEHRISFANGAGMPVCLSVYSVAEDLVGCIPMMGDLHLHTIRSDGKEDPAIVAANLRRQGYDFIAITDHEKICGSLESIEAYKGAPIEMNLLTGEEVHLPDCLPHIVHIGGRYSINAMVESPEKRNGGANSKFDDPPLDGKSNDFPGTMTEEEFHRAIEAYAETLEAIPEDVPRFAYAAFHWICNEIRKAGGLSIFAHPYWIHDNPEGGVAFHVSEQMTQYLFETQPFDAFEVLGGDICFEQNGFQTAHYYEARERGLKFPIVGSSDSHGTVNNRNAFVAETICFAKENTTEGILEAIRSGRTVALDTISTEFRLVGDYRLIKYAGFLMNEYFPLHQDACNEQGRAMKEYYCGDREEGLRLLNVLNGRIEKMWKKYFSF